MGRKVEHKLAQNALIAYYYDLYNMCRTKQFVTFRKPVRGSTKGEEKIVVATWPSGYSILPHVGGVEDQPYIVARLFSAAMRGELEGFKRVVEKP